jgi:hypothetical protein
MAVRVMKKKEGMLVMKCPKCGGEMEEEEKED